MSQNTQVVPAALATVHREIPRVFVFFATEHPRVHWQVAQPETTEGRTLCRAKNAALALGSALLFLGCNVYDSSLIDTSALASHAGSDGGGQLATAGNAPDATAGNGTGSAAGSAESAAGSNGLAGMDSAGDSSGGSSGGVAGAGTVGVAGSGAVAGSSGGAPAGGAGGAVNATYSLIDDMETADANIPPADGRQGFWSVANDGTVGGKQTPSPTVTMSLIPEGRGASLNAFHTTAMGYTASGALIGVDLNRKGATRNTYDASPYNAVHFWLRVEAGSPTAVHFAILDKHTDPGGAWCCISATNCTGGGTFATGGLCYDHFGKDLPAATTQWTERAVTFAELGQVGWGDNKVNDLDTAHVFAIQFDWMSAAMDLWIDDISFVKK